MTDPDGRKFEYMKRLEYHDISHARHRILTVFWNHTDSRLENAYPSRETVAAKANVSLTTLDNAIKWAKSNGYMEVQREATSHKPVTYRLPMPPDLSPRGGEVEPDGSPTIGEAQTDSPTIGEGGSPVSGEGGSPTIGDLTDPLPDPVSDPPPTPTASAQHEPGPARDGEGGSFQEWIELFPSSKRKNLRDARSKYAETIKNIEHSILMDSTRAYLDHEQQNEAGKYIGQALAVLTDRRWEKHKPKPDPNLTQLRTLEALAQNYPPDSPERQDYAESIKEERARLVQQGYVEDGAGGLKLPELTPEQRKSRADAHRRNEYLRYA